MFFVITVETKQIGGSKPISLIEREVDSWVIGEIIEIGWIIIKNAWTYRHNEVLIVEHDEIKRKYPKAKCSP